MSDNVADCMKKLEDFRVCVKECHDKTERNFPRAPLRDVKDSKPTAEQIDNLLTTLTKTKDSLEDYKKLIDEIQTTLLKTNIHIFEEEKGLRKNPGRQSKLFSKFVYFNNYFNKFKRFQRIQMFGLIVFTKC